MEKKDIFICHYLRFLERIGIGDEMGRHLFEISAAAIFCGCRSYWEWLPQLQKTGAATIRRRIAGTFHLCLHPLTYEIQSIKDCVKGETWLHKTSWGV